MTALRIYGYVYCMNNSKDIWQRVDVINRLRDVWQHASAAMPDWEIDFEVAADAVIAGDVEPDDNEGLIASDDIIGQRCFGAIMSDGPWWIKRDE